MRTEIRTDGPTDRHDETNSRFSQFCEPKATNAHTYCVTLIVSP
jgi:hypothetical protein